MLRTIIIFHGSVDLVGSIGITHAVTVRCYLELFSSEGSISIWLNIQDGFFTQISGGWDGWYSWIPDISLPPSD